MKAEIISVGSEVLSGDTINTNASAVAKALEEQGIAVIYHTVVGDDHDNLYSALEQAFRRAELVVTTGGLGPTYDDMTKETVAKFFGRNLVIDEDTAEWIRNFFKQMNRPMTANNMKQAEIIEGATVLKNDFGVAPGMLYQTDNRMIAMLPGPPFEMEPMLNGYLMPLLSEDTNDVLVSVFVRTFGIGESNLESGLHDLMVTLKNPVIAPYAKRGEVTLKVTARAKTKKEAKALIKPVIHEISNQYGEYIYSITEPNLQTELVKRLRSAGKTVAVAESCTGGMIASHITEVPGSSGVFGYGVVTYANEAKMKILGVNEQTLKDYGAVSDQTAREMAEGVRRLSSADIGVAVTGIAGPDGGTKDKPVGLVYLAVTTKSDTKVTRLMLSRSRKDERASIRERTAMYALFECLKVVN